MLSAMAAPQPGSSVGISKSTDPYLTTAPTGNYKRGYAAVRNQEDGSHELRKSIVCRRPIYSPCEEWACGLTKVKANDNTTAAAFRRDSLVHTISAATTIKRI